MKKLVALILAVFYLGSASGTTVHFHYCMGKLADWGIEYTGNKRCPKCGMDKKVKTSLSKEGCCQDQSQQLKIDKVQRAEGSIFNFQQTVIIILGHSFFELPGLFEPYVSDPLNNTPPKDIKASIFLRNCTFRI